MQRAQRQRSRGVASGNGRGPKEAQHPTRSRRGGARRSRQAIQSCMSARPIVNATAWPLGREAHAYVTAESGVRFHLVTTEDAVAGLLLRAVAAVAALRSRISIGRAR